MERQFLGQVDDFVNSDLLHFEEFATLTPSVKDKLRRMVEQYHDNEEDWDLEALIHTGVPAVEETICEYVDKYAYPMKINDAVKDILAILDELDMRSKFDKALSSDKEKLARVKKQIEEAKSKHKESQKLSDDFKKKIDGFKLDGVSEKKELIKIEKELGDLTLPYNDVGEIDKDEAEDLISAFENALNDYQKECEATLIREIDTNLFQKGDQMLDEYTTLVRALLENIKIEDFKFEKIKRFNDIKIGDFEEIKKVKKDSESTRYKYETRWKDNPEREGFWGRFKFWKPKQVSYEKKVKDGINVNVFNVITYEMGTFEENMKENITNMFEKAYAQLEDYKNTFSDNIDTLDDEIITILEELEQSTNESKELENRIVSNKKISDWVDEKEKQIRTLLAF